MACYAGQLQAPEEGISGNFWCSVVTLITFSSKFNNLEREKNQRNPKNVKNYPKNLLSFIFFLLKKSTKILIKNLLKK